MMVILQPVAMIAPTAECIYAASRIETTREITEEEFLTRFADYPLSALVSLEADGKSNPQQTTVYGCGLDCWYIVKEVTGDDIR